MAKNMPKITGVNLSSCEFKIADFRKYAIVELQSCGCGTTFLKVAELGLRKYFLQVAVLRLRTQKEVVRAHL
jgi:hypothetical protein